MSTEPQMSIETPAPAVDVSSSTPPSEQDVLLRKAVKVIFADPSLATASRIAKALGASMSEGLHIMDELETAGILSPFNKHKVDSPRKLLILKLPQDGRFCDPDADAAEQQPSPKLTVSPAEGELLPQEPRTAAGAVDVAGREQITYIPLDKLFPSQSPAQVLRRASFNQAAIAELASSIDAQGLLQPLVVRPRPGSWDEAGDCEIVAGERRWLACKSLYNNPPLRKLDDPRTDLIPFYSGVPCIVRALTDAECMELQLVENLQREGTHPLEEAAGYHALLKLREAGPDAGPDAGEEKKNVAYIAQQVGKSVSYIFQRLKLLALGKEAKQAFQSGELSASHALDCARLKPLDQAEYLRVFRKVEGTTPSVRQMREWIGQHVRIDLARAPFSLKDAKLLSDTPACSTCVKCSIAQPDLFADFTEQAAPAEKRKKGEKASALCMDAKCYQMKMDAFVQQQAAKFAGELGIDPILVYAGADWGTNNDQHPLLVDVATMPCLLDMTEVLEEDCKFSEPVILVGGNRPGQRTWICRNHECPKHYDGAKVGKIYGHAGERKECADYDDNVDDPSRSDEEIYHGGGGGFGLPIDRSLEEKQRKQERAAREQAFQAICRALPHHQQSVEDLRDIASAFYASLNYDDRDLLATLLRWKSKDRQVPADVVIASSTRGYLKALLLKMSLVGEVHHDIVEPVLLEAVGSRYGVSLAELRKPSTKSGAKKKVGTK
jgi:hypothetical protein